jgi:hypothetical protein
VQITVNLADALQTLRHSTFVRILWADALCINQTDVIERAEQVKLMGLIYWKAFRVQIWLGQDDDIEESYRAKHAIRIIRQLAKVHLAALGTTAEDYKIYREIIFDEPGSITRSEWTALHRLLERPWFQRVWVVQELGLSRDSVFHCGHCHFTKTDLKEFTSLLHHSRSHLIKPHNLNLQMVHLGDYYWRSCRGNTRLELGSHPKEAETFMDILAKTRGLSCTDARDSVYAFLGHPSAFKRRKLDVDPYNWYPTNYYQGRSTVILPNYKKSNTFLKIYTELAVAAIKDLGLGLNVISHIAHNEETIETDFPSWVPRWDVRGHPSNFAGAEVYFAASSSLPDTTFELVSSRRKRIIYELSLKALRLDTIRCVRRVPIMETLEESADLMALLLSDAPKMRRPCAIPIPSSLSYPYEEPFVLAFASTMTAGLTSSWDQYCEPVHEHASQHIRNFHAYYRRQQSPNLSSLAKADVEHAGYFTLDVKRESPGRVFFITHDGRFGLGPSVMEGSDEIWIPMGARMPVILRPYAHGKSKIIGQTYLYGVMRGEAVKGKSERDFETVTLF